MTAAPHDPTPPDWPSEATLHAYVDARLAPAESLQVAQWLQGHPQVAERVLAWQAQRQQLRSLHVSVLDEPVPPALRAALVQPAARWPYALAASVLLAVGAALGWTLRPLLADGAAPLAGAPRAGAEAQAFVREAAVAHVVYLPERRHPVEVGADQRDHLVQWLSKRLGAPLKAPALEDQGYQLMGGRLLPGGTDPKAAQAPRAQFMYENANGQRVTLYVSSFAEGQLAPTAFQFNTDGQTNTFYWIDGRQGYALSAQLPRATLATLADAVYKQLGP